MAQARTIQAEIAGEEPWPRETYAWYVIAILFLVTLFSHLDRQLPALLVQPIKQQFAISDTGFSYLQGYAFAFVYTFAGLPFGRLVDKANRRNLIAVGIIIWSAMTVLCGFAQDYWQLFVGRMGVGIGEAVLAPAAYSIIADYVAPQRRGRAIGIYYVSLAIGAGASLFLGGMILGALPADGLIVPLVGRMAPWQLMFLLAGLPGLPVFALIFTIREPRRRDMGALQASHQQGSIAEFTAYIMRHKATFGRILVYPAVMAVISYGALAWAPAFYQRKFEVSPAHAGQMVGALVAVSGLSGTLFSAFLSDRLGERHMPAARLRVTLAGWLLVLPSLLLWPLVPDLRVSLLFLGLANGGAAIAQAAAPSIIQDIMPNRMRGQAVVLYLLLAGICGIGFGPTAVALVTDRLFGSDADLPYSLVLVGLPMALAGLWLCLSGLKPYARTQTALAAGEA